VFKDLQKAETELQIEQNVFTESKSFPGISEGNNENENENTNELSE